MLYNRRGDRAVYARKGGGRNRRSHYPDKRNLYRFPWSTDDNPTGWLEVTDVCNFNCRGCYRLNLAGNKPLDDIRNEVCFLRRSRNVDAILVSGGKAVLHPQIGEIVALIARSGLKSWLLSNGLQVTKDLLRDLARRGLTGVGFHVDSLQDRPGCEGRNELELCEVRQKYVDMVCEVQGLARPGFGMTVCRENLPQIPDVLRWILDNRGRAGGMAFVTYRAAVKRGFDYFANGKRVEAADELSRAANGPGGGRRHQVGGHLLRHQADAA